MPSPVRTRRGRTPDGCSNTSGVLTIWTLGRPGLELVANSRAGLVSPEAQGCDDDPDWSTYLLTSL